MTTGPDNKQIEGHAFFDPRTPRVPTEVLGIPTGPLMDLGTALGDLALIGSSKMPYRLSHPLYLAGRSTGEALALFSLIEQVQSGEYVGPKDVRLYRKPIKRLIPKLSTADRFAALSGGLLFGIPIRRAINRKIEEEFPQRVRPLIDKTSDYLPQAEPYVDFIGEFDNPRGQFVSEVAVVAQGIRSAAYSRAQQRSRSNAVTVTAEDAAFGIRQTIEEILSDKKVAEQRMPMFSHFVIGQLPKNAPLPSSEVLGVAAPEIMNALDAALPKDQQDANFLSSIRDNPHPKRWLAERFKGTELRSLHEVSVLLLPSIRDLLPTSGQEVRDTFARAKNFLKTDQKKTKE